MVQGVQWPTQCPSYRASDEPVPHSVNAILLQYTRHRESLPRPAGAGGSALLTCGVEQQHCAGCAGRDVLQVDHVVRLSRARQNLQTAQASLRPTIYIPYQVKVL